MKLNIRREAEQDIDYAFGWYRINAPHVANRFLDALDAVFALIVERPELFPVAYRDLRRATVRRFPFSVYYRVNDADVTVFAVLHQHRADEIWRKR